MTEHRSGFDPQNLDALVKTGMSGRALKRSGQGQYYTPPELAAEIRQHLLVRHGEPPNVFDPQCGEGALLRDWPMRTRTYGWEIDHRLGGFQPGREHQHYHASCLEMAELLAGLEDSDLLEVACVVANPPFSLDWKQADGTRIDSTLWTWQYSTAVGRYGCLLTLSSIADRLNLGLGNPLIYQIDRRPLGQYWPGMRQEHELALIYWEHEPDRRECYLSPTGCARHFDAAYEIIQEERGNPPSHNLTLDRRGRIHTYLSTRDKRIRGLSAREFQRLACLGSKRPMALVPEKQTRELLRSLVAEQTYTISPECEAAINEALSQAQHAAVPIMPVTDFQRVAYCDEVAGGLLCIKEMPGLFKVGQRYAVDTESYEVHHYYDRKVRRVRDEELVVEDHRFHRYGQDRATLVKTGQSYYAGRRQVAFRAHLKPEDLTETMRPEAELWEYFERPAVPTVAEVMPEKYTRNEQTLETLALLGGFTFYPGQLDYLARVFCRDQALIAAETGTGKTVMAIAAVALKCPAGRALICAPQGTLRSSKSKKKQPFLDDDEAPAEAPEKAASQWVSELRKFAPWMAVFELFCREDVARIQAANAGKLPPGVYVTYYEAFFTNQCMESLPPRMSEDRYCRQFSLQPHVLTDEDGQERIDLAYHTENIGEEDEHQMGIRCVARPSLATEFGDLFDMACFDEAHLLKNLGAQRTQLAIRLQPSIRYALTATPIPNTASDLFSIMGWLRVPGWYRGDQLNASWPFQRADLSQFEQTFLSREENQTLKAEAKREERSGPKPRRSPVLSNPALLLKLTTPTLAYISKPDCSDTYRRPQIFDIRVPLGKQQMSLYEHHLDLSNVERYCQLNSDNPLTRARIKKAAQQNYLRGTCTAPSALPYNPQLVRSDMNPKMVAMLELIGECLGRGEQVVIVNARTAPSDALERLLAQAGIACSRIDTTVPASSHARQSWQFKQGKTRVMLMGIKCAQGHSYSDCPNLLIGSLEYNAGSFEQACGRVDRINSGTPPRIYVILTEQTIEEAMFDTVATKDDAAKIVLRGQRVARDWQEIDLDDVLARSILSFDNKVATVDELELEARWPALRSTLQAKASLAA